MENKSTILSIGILLAILLGVGAAAVYLGSPKNTSTQQSGPTQNTITPTIVPTDTPGDKGQKQGLFRTPQKYLDLPPLK